MEMKILRLNEIIGTNEIFGTIMEDHEVPWAEDADITAALLDFEYLNNFSGRKVISPAVNNFIGADGIITSASFTKLCDIAYMMYAKKWARNWAILNAEYNPIENYSMVEDSKLTRDNKQTHSGNDTTVTSGSVADSASSSSEDEVSAFNSSTYQDATKNTGTGSNTKTYNNLTEQVTNGHVIDNDDDERNHLTRSGNIGVTTSQQMLQSEIDLWKWNFFYEVFTDIDTIFTISTY